MSQSGRTIDPEAQGRCLVEVLTLADTLPYRPRPLARAQLRGSATQPSPA